MRAEVLSSAETTTLTAAAAVCTHIQNEFVSMFESQRVVITLQAVSGHNTVLKTIERHQKGC